MSNEITQCHLERKAILYIRQSSPHQALHRKESQLLQYEMKKRLQSFGFNEIEVIDEDLGRTASGSARRTGLQRMIAEVCLSNVGAVAAREVSRFARNSREWHQLVEMCRVVNTVLIDHETVYDPRNSNNRLLLGLKGSLNEYELDLLRHRSQEACKQKAARGELILVAPVGYIKVDNYGLEKDPDSRVQKVLGLLFSKSLEVGSARQTMMWFIDNGIDIPVRRKTKNRWDTAWKRAKYSTVVKTLRDPTYAGYYVWGKIQVVSTVRDGVLCKRVRKRPVGQYSVLIPDHHEGYISKQDFERIQQMLSSNHPIGSTGAPKHGAGLLRSMFRSNQSNG